MVLKEQLAKSLQAKFPEEEVGRVSKKGGSYDYIESRSVQDRLDDVFGPMGWSTHYTVVDAAACAVECTISVLDSETGQWISKSDVGYPNNAVGAKSKSGDQIDSKTPLKDAYSGALKRAAVQWGIARYLYPTANKTERYGDDDDGDKPASATQLRQIKDLADEVGEALAIPNDLSSADAETMIGKLESTATDQRDKLKTVKRRLNEAMTQLADKSGDSQNEIVDRIKKSVGIKTAKVSEATLDQLLDAEKYVLAALDKAA